jgi:hypothetical protein
MARRAVEIGAALVWASETGQHVIWGSLTCWHNSYSPLRDLIEIQRAAWRSVVNSRFWRESDSLSWPHSHGPECVRPCRRKRDREIVDGGLTGYIRASELNVGPNGWHPHFHPLLIHSGSAVRASAFADAVVDQWVYGIEQAGGVAMRDGAQLLRVLSPGEAVEHLGDYMTKQTYAAQKRLGLEAVWSQSKYGRGRPSQTVAHWSLLDGIGAGLVDDVDSWHELEAATRGHRMISWSRGLRQLANVGEEASDEDIAAEEIGTEDDTVAIITANGWSVLRDQPVQLSALLTVLEHGGWARARAHLDALGVEYVRF